MSAIGCSSAERADAVGAVAVLEAAEQLALGDQHDGHELEADGEDHERLEDLDPPGLVVADLGEDRRGAPVLGLLGTDFLKTGAAVAGGAAIAGPFQGFSPRRCPSRPWLPADPGPNVLARPRRPAAPFEVVRLALPPGFQYRSFQPTAGPVPSSSTTAPGCPGGTTAWPRSAGRAATHPGAQPRGQRRRARVRRPPARRLRPDGAGGTTTVEVTREGEVLRVVTSINGTQMNCSGGTMPWGSWVTCEETVNGPDVGRRLHRRRRTPLDRLAAARTGSSSRCPPTAQSDRRADHGRRAVRARVGRVRPARRRALPDRGQLRLPVRLLPVRRRREPDETGRLADGGRLQMLRPSGQPNADLAAQQRRGDDATRSTGSTSTTRRRRSRHAGAPAPTTNDDAISYVGNQGRAQGAAHFSRLEGAIYDDGRRLLHLDAGRRRRPSRATGTDRDGFGNG